MSEVSIIVPCYNLEDHIEECVSSLLGQTFSNFELLLIDDGSSDRTLSILKEYEKNDNRIRVFTHSNQGVSFTRNRGIDLATADYIIFVDGDDYVKNDFIEQHIKNMSPETWLLSGMVGVKNNEEEKSIYFKQLLELFPTHEIEKENVLKLLQYNSLSSPWCKVFSRKTLIDNKIKFDVSVTYQEDLLFNLSYLKYISEIKIIDYFGYFYEEHPGSLSSRFHQSFSQVEELYKELKLLIRTDSDKEIVQKFIFQTTLRKIANVFHVKSTKSKQEKLEELKDIFNSEYYSFSFSYIDKSQVNFLLKKVLKLKSSQLLYAYFSLRK